MKETINKGDYWTTTVQKAGNLYVVKSESVGDEQSIVFDAEELDALVAWWMHEKGAKVVEGIVEHRWTDNGAYVYTGIDGFEIDTHLDELAKSRKPVRIIIEEVEES